MTTTTQIRAFFEGFKETNIGLGKAFTDASTLTNAEFELQFGAYLPVMAHLMQARAANFPVYGRPAVKHFASQA